jgi:hypothetical protein
VTNVTIAGQIGTAIAAVQLQATNSPTSFSASPMLGDYGLQLSATGLLSGTPTQMASGIAVPFTASNGAGLSEPGTITLNLVSAPVTSPPAGTPSTSTSTPSTDGVTSGGAASSGGSTGSSSSGTSTTISTPPVIAPPIVTKTTPSLTFSSPVSAIMVGQPISLGALSSVGLPVTYTLVSGDATLNGDVLTPMSTATLVVRASTAGTDQYNATSTDVNFGNPQKAAQAITVTLPSAIATGANSATVHADSPVVLSATTTSGLPVTYSVVSGMATISGNTLTFTGTGNVTVRASQAGNNAYAPAQDVTLTFTANPINRLVNLSARLRVTAGDASTGAIAGFVVTGSSPKPLLIRAVGPTLSTYGVSTPLADPHLQVFDSKGVSLATNAGWANDATIATNSGSLGAFNLNTSSKDAALLLTLPPGSYTAQVSSPSNAGTVLVEVYDASANVSVPTRQLINLSTRGVVGTGDDAIVAGFVVAGVEPKRLLIRGVGPALSAYGVSGVLADPMLKLFDAQGTVLARNDNWETATTGDALHFTTTAADVTAADFAAGAFPLNAGSRDAVLVLTLNPGTYTAQVSGVNNATGAALVEVYELP